MKTYSTQDVHWNEVKTTDGRIRAWMVATDGAILSKIEQFKTQPGWKVETKENGKWKTRRLVEMETWEVQMFVALHVL
jgi:transposase